MRERTGLVLDPYFSAPKMAWIREHLTRDGVVTTSDAWLLHHLTGELVTDLTTAAFTGALATRNDAWWPEALARYGLAAEQLATPRLPGTRCGRTTARAEHLLQRRAVAPEVERQLVALADH